MISKLYAAHQGGEVNTGFDNEGEGSSSSGVVDVLEKGVLDLYLGKFTGVKLACSAACTVLRVDQVRWRGGTWAISSRGFPGPMHTSH